MWGRPLARHTGRTLSHVSGAVREGPWVCLQAGSFKSGGGWSRTGCVIRHRSPMLDTAPQGGPARFSFLRGDDSSPEIFPKVAADIQEVRSVKTLRAEQSGGGLWGHLLAKVGEARVVSCLPAGQGQVGAGAAGGKTKSRGRSRSRLEERGGGAPDKGRDRAERATSWDPLALCSDPPQGSENSPVTFAKELPQPDPTWGVL